MSTDVVRYLVAVADRRRDGDSGFPADHACPASADPPRRRSRGRCRCAPVLVSEEPARFDFAPPSSGRGRENPPEAADEDGPSGSVRPGRSRPRAASETAHPGASGRGGDVGLQAEMAGAASALHRLASGVRDLVHAELADLSDHAIRELLGEVQGSLRRLEAVRTRAAGILEARAVAAVPDGEGPRVRQAARRRLRDDLGLTPGEAKQASEVGTRLMEAPALAAAHREGDISQAHARVITELLTDVPASRRAAFEKALVGWARLVDAQTLCRRGRRLLAREDRAAAEARAERQHARRSVSVSATEDGGLAGRVMLYGLQAEKLRTVLQAFAQPDGPGGSVRTPGQRYADALEQALDVALRSGKASTQHGVRPHVLVVVDHRELVSGGIADLGYTGPVTMAELRPLLTDCTVSRVVIGPDSAPIEAGEAVRTVPAGLWRQLLARDRGCTWSGCDAPAAWCDVAHGQVPFRKGGRLRADNAALLCRRHHRQFDRGLWRMSIEAASVTYTRSDRSEVGPPAARSSDTMVQHVKQRASAAASSPRTRQPGSDGTSPPRAGPGAASSRRARPG